MLKTFDLLLDVEKNVYSQYNPAFTVNQNDLNSVELTITLQRDSIPVDITGTTPRLAVLKPSGLTTYSDGTVYDGVNGVFKIVLNTQSYVEVGTHTAEIMLYQGEQVAVSGTFTYKSQKAILNDGSLASNNDFQALNKLIADLQESINNTGYTKSEVDLTTNTIVPKHHSFGGQLKKLKDSLSNPLEQFVGISFIGDSITWGRTLSDNGVYDPRTGALTDPRDNNTSKSFVNNFKRYIGTNYAKGTTPVLSNFSTSPSGQSIAEYTIQHILYPKGGDFTLTTTGTSTSVTEALTPSSITGSVYRLGCASTGTGVHNLSFNFTGDSFTLAFGVTSAYINYELFVDGVSQGVFTAQSGVDGVVLGNNNQRIHTFPYVKNKLIEIKTRQSGFVGTAELRVEGIIINKKIRISNNGIIGATSVSYKANCMTNSPTAVDSRDNYVFCQFGTNDRITNASIPKGLNTFKVNLKALLSSITNGADIILMNANPVFNESPVTYNFTMQGVRGVIYRVGKESSYDVIDNYALFDGVDINSVTSDGLHPNETGHLAISRSIINSLENA